MSRGDGLSPPDPTAVHDLESLARELERLRVRAARGTAAVRVPLSAIAKGIGISPTRKSTLSNYLAGKTLPPSDLLDQIVIALGAAPHEQRQWSEAWYRVYESRRTGSADALPRQHEYRPAVRIDREADGGPGLELALPPARMARGYDEANLNAATALDDWLGDEASNLAIVMGDFGSGKTTTLEDFVNRHSAGKHRPHYSRYADIRVDDFAVNRPEGSYHLLVVDDFDAFNTVGGDQVPPPDLRELVDPLRDVDKILVATRRTSRNRQDELIRQLERPRRYDRFQVRHPTIIELQPYPHEILVQIGQAMSNPAFQDFFQLLAPGGLLASRQLRNPLFLSSMVTESDRLRAGETWSIAQIYEEYVENVLTEDFDRRRSRIVEPQKRAILAGIADHIFCAAELEPEEDEGSPVQRGVQYDEVSALVEAQVGPHPLPRRGGEGEGYDWTRDFLATSHLVVERNAERLLPLRSEYHFTHRSFYDLFLARALIAKVARGEALGLNIESPRPHYFESLTPYFMRSFLSGPMEKAMVRLARRQNLPMTDRLLLLHLLEDHPDFAVLLESAPQEYAGQLEVWLEKVTSLYLRKVIMYQLVVLRRCSAYVYVNAARADEQHYDVSRENLTLTGEVTVTQFQLRRLENPALVAAQPIAVYRLGQLGSHAAIDPLRRLRKREREPRLRQLIDEAIERIESRSASYVGEELGRTV